MAEDDGLLPSPPPRFSRSPRVAPPCKQTTPPEESLVSLSPSSSVSHRATQPKGARLVVLPLPLPLPQHGHPFRHPRQRARAHDRPQGASLPVLEPLSCPLRIAGSRLEARATEFGGLGGEEQWVTVNVRLPPSSLSFARDKGRRGPAQCGAGARATRLSAQRLSWANRDRAKRARAESGPW